jgi:hypothetical protein
VIPELAIDNNVALYGAIFRAHGIAAERDDHCWSTDAQPPPYYSRLVTRSRGSLARQAQLRRLEEVATRAQGQGWGCKDSFDELPEQAMGDLGLRVLLRAWWYGWAEGTVVSGSETDLVARAVESPEALLAWEDAWRQSSPASTPRVFPNEVLEDTGLELFTVSLQGRMAGGFILNQSDAAVGLSNVFRMEDSTVEAGVFLRECARHAGRLHPRRAVVGYGPRSQVDSLARLGFATLGPLAVWTTG